MIATATPEKMQIELAARKKTLGLSKPRRKLLKENEPILELDSNDDESIIVPCTTRSGRNAKKLLL